MASDHGPSIEPGWPNLKGPDIVGAYMTGAQLGASVNKARMELEAKYQKMQNDMEISQAKHETAMQIADWRHQSDMDKIAIAQEGVRQKGERVDQQREQMEFNMQKFFDQSDAKDQIMGIGGQLEREGYIRGTKQYYDEFSKRSAGISGRLPTSTYNAVMRGLQTNYNADALRFMREFNNEDKILKEDIGDQVWGNRLYNNPDPILHPEKYPHMETEGEFRLGMFAIPGTGTKKPTGDIEVQGQDAQGNPKTLVIPRKVVDDLKARWDAKEEKRKQLGTFAHDPANQVFAPGTGMVTIRDSNGDQWTIPQDKLPAAKARDPKLVIIP